MLEVDRVSLCYGENEVVRNVSLHLGTGEIGCLLGPSGCGKTTLLRAIGGFESVRAGRIVLDGVSVATADTHVPARERGVGMVFQDHALFPHLNVRDNVGFGLRSLTVAQRQERVDELLTLVGLGNMQQRWPHELSGGQQQRVALARALAPRPRLLLLDEPFSNLDTSLREAIAREVRNILRQAGATALMVTHDQHEAFAMADRVGVMVAGKLCQWASAFEVYRHPATREVATLVGEGTLLTAQQAPLGAGWLTALGWVDPVTPHFDDGPCPAVLLRPESLHLDRGSLTRGTVTERLYRGSHFLYTVQVGNEAQVMVHGNVDDALEVGADVGVRVG